MREAGHKTASSGTFFRGVRDAGHRDIPPEEMSRCPGTVGGTNRTHGGTSVGSTLVVITSVGTCLPALGRSAHPALRDRDESQKREMQMSNEVKESGPAVTFIRQAATGLDLLTDWDRGFVKSCQRHIDRGTVLTDKQLRMLESIAVTAGKVHAMREALAELVRINEAETWTLHYDEINNAWTAAQDALRETEAQP